MDVKCCKCKKEYDLASNIFEYKKDTNCPILICPYCGFKHIINFMPFEKRIKVKKIKKLDLAFTVVILGASRIANASREDHSEVDDNVIGDWNKANNFILATRIYTSKGPLARAYKLRWRISGGTFADVGSTGAINYSAITDLIDDNELVIGEKLCGVQTDYTWQNGLENEGDNVLPNSGTYSLADEYYTEFQWALNCVGAAEDVTYEFELWDITEGASIGTCLCTITIKGFNPYNDKLADPATLPTSGAYKSAFTPDDIYLAIPYTAGVNIYKRSGDTFTFLEKLSTSISYGSAFSPDGIYLAVTQATSPWCKIWKRSGDTFTYLSSPFDTPPTATCYEIYFSHNGTYLVFGSGGANNLELFKRTGDSFALITPAISPIGASRAVAFSHDDLYLAVGSAGDPKFIVYKRSGDTFTKLTDPTYQPASVPRGVVFSHDSLYMAVAIESSPRLIIYKRSGDVFTKLTDPSYLPSNYAYKVDFSGLSEYLSVAHRNPAHITTYERDGDDFNVVARPTVIPTELNMYASGVTFSHNDAYLVLTFSIAPRMHIYKSSLADNGLIWNTKTISKWNTKEFTKWNDLE